MLSAETQRSITPRKMTAQKMTPKVDEMVIKKMIKDEQNADPKRIKLVTRDGQVVEDYEDEYFAEDDTPLADLPDTQAAIANDEDAERAAAINAMTERGQQEFNDMWHRLDNVAEIEARTDAFKSPEGKLDRMARARMDRAGGTMTYEQAYAQESLAHPDLSFDELNRARKNREQIAADQRQRDREQ